jgi:hypothetical protein
MAFSPLRRGSIPCGTTVTTSGQEPELEQELGWMYETLHADGKTKGRANYIVWSDVFACPNCGSEVTFLDEALDPKTGRVKEKFPCPGCRAELTKTRMDRLYEVYMDHVLGESMKRIKRRPVLINYSIGKHKFEKRPDDNDLQLLRSIEAIQPYASLPANEIPFMHMTHQRAHMDAFGITHIHHYYLERTSWVLGTLWAKISSIDDHSCSLKRF